MKKSLQLYSLRNYKGLDEQLALCHKHGLEYVEMVEFHGMAHHELEALLQKNSIKASSILGSLDFIQENKKEIISFLKNQGAKFVSISWFYSMEKEAWLSFAREVEQLAQELAKSSIQLGYHHHEHEFFMHFDQGDAIDLLLREAPSILLLCDIAWVFAGQKNILEYLDTYKSRICQIHIKDLGYSYAAKREFPKRFGEGIIPLKKIINKAKQLPNIQDYILEMDDPEDYELFVCSGVQLFKEVL